MINATDDFSLSIISQNNTVRRTVPVKSLVVKLLCLPFYIRPRQSVTLVVLMVVMLVVP